MYSRCNLRLLKKNKTSYLNEKKNGIFSKLGVIKAEPFYKQVR